MQIFDRDEVLQTVCKATKKYGMIVCFANYSHSREILKAIPFLNVNEHSQILGDGQGYFLFESKEELDSYYLQIVGDDGPTELNSYDGTARVYALTCSPEGTFLNENT